ncbi:MAG TPA: hypothetical protein VGE63_01115 [Candidatus Paceibacterota bacterium]
MLRLSHSPFPALKQKFHHKKYQLGFFGILIIIALISDQILTAIGSISVFVSIFTSIIYVYSLVFIGSTGLIMLDKNTTNPLTKQYWLTLKKQSKDLAKKIIKPTGSLILGSMVTFILVIIPGILFVIRSMFVIPQTVLGNANLKEAYKNSFYQTSKLTRHHLGFFGLFAITIFLFVSTSGIISNFSSSLIFLIILLPLLTVSSFITANNYLELYSKSPVALPEKDADTD